MPRVETYDLEPVCLDAGDELASLRSLHGISSTLSGGEWYHHKMLEIKTTKQNKISSRRQGYGYQSVGHENERPLQYPNEASWGQSLKKKNTNKPNPKAVMRKQKKGES